MKPRMESPRNRSLAKPRQAISIALAALAVAAMVTLLPAATGDTIADGVLGQPDFVHESPNTVNGAGMSAPDFVAVDQSATPNHLYVVDTANNRVLGWKTAASFADGAAADLVIGQPDFFSSRPNVTNSQPTANTLYNPTGVAVDSNGNLYVADSGNNRVLKYSAPFSACDDTFPCAGQGAQVRSLGNSAISPRAVVTSKASLLPPTPTACADRTGWRSTVTTISTSPIPSITGCSSTSRR